MYMDVLQNSMKHMTEESRNEWSTNDTFQQDGDYSLLEAGTRAAEWHVSNFLLICEDTHNLKCVLHRTHGNNER